MGDPSRAGSLRPFFAALGAAAAGCLVFALLLSSSLSATTRESIGGTGLLLGGLAVVASTGVAAVRSQGSRRTAWILLCAAASTGLVTNLVTEAMAIDPMEDTGFVGGALAVAMMLSIVGLIRLPSTRQRGAELGLMMLDGLVMGCAVLVIASITVFTPLVEAGTGSVVDEAAALLLPCLDVALATIALLLLVRSEGDRWFYSLIGSGFLLMAAADMAFAVQAAEGTFRLGTLEDLGWIAGYLLFAAAARHPQASVPEKQAPDDPASGVRGTILVFAILMTALVVQLMYPKDDLLTSTQMVLWLLLVLAAGTRQTLLAADNSALRNGLERRVREQTADLRRMSRHT